MYLVTILFKKKYFFFEKIEKNNILFHFKFLFIFFIVSDNFKIQNSPKQTWIKDILYKFKTLDHPNTVGTQNHSNRSDTQDCPVGAWITNCSDRAGT